MMPLLRTLLPVVILAGAGIAGAVLLITGPEAKRKPSSVNVTTVETLVVQPEPYAIVVHSRGEIAPRVQSDLTSEVAGRLVEISPQFVPGGYFKEGEVLARLDPDSYHLQVANLEAAVEAAEARQKELAITEENLHRIITIETQQVDLAQRSLNRLNRLHKKGVSTESAQEEAERELLDRKSVV